MCSRRIIQINQFFHLYVHALSSQYVISQYLEKHGYEVTYLDVDENGMVSPEAVVAAIRPGTVLPATVNQGLHLDALPDIEKSDPFRAVQFVRACTERHGVPGGGSSSNTTGNGADFRYGGEQ